MVELSVVIPTYNRRDTLLCCLRALERQTLDRARYEIIAVDDGSSDGTVAAMQEWPRVRFLRQSRNAGPAAARNIGVRAAHGRWILFLGDDTIARPPLLEQHLAAHVEQPGDQVAVLGYAPWREDREITPLMRYLWAGPITFRQFHYSAIMDPDNVPYPFFYTCNLSLSRDFMLRHGLFDEEFRFAYGEDTDLGYRLQQRGLRIVFRQELVVDHDHPTSYQSVRRRAQVAGEIGLLLVRKHPDMGDTKFLRFSRKTRVANAIKRWTTQALLDPVLDLADRQRWDHPLLARAYDWALKEHQLWGLLDALDAPMRSTP